MKSFVILSVLVAVTYGAPQHQNKTQVINPDVSNHCSYDPINGIAAQEQGYLKGTINKGADAQIAQDSYTYTSPEGIRYTVPNTPDKNDFRAEGPLLPIQAPTSDPAQPQN